MNFFKTDFSANTFQPFFIRENFFEISRIIEPYTRLFTDPIFTHVYYQKHDSYGWMIAKRGHFVH